MDNESAKDVYKEFPWLSKFLMLTIQSIDSRDERILENLIITFLRFTSADMRQCYTRPKRAAKLIPIVTQVLIHFNMFYTDIKSDMTSVSVYLGLMSDLIALYMDLKIKASKLGVESVKKVAHTITSAIYIFLDYSEAHIAEAILKAKLMSKANGELCTFVLSKFLKDADCSITQDSDYMRFLLVFKLWKKIRTDPKERKVISEIAVCKLNPPPEVINHVKKMREISGVGENITFLLMNSKIDLIKSKREFLRSSGLSKYRETPAQEFPVMDFFLDYPSRNDSQEETTHHGKTDAEPHSDNEMSRVGKMLSRENDWRPVANKKPESEGVDEPEGAGKSVHTLEAARVESNNSSENLLVGKACGNLQSVERCSQNSKSVEPKTLKFETVASRFKIVKSNKLRKDLQNLPEKPMKEFNFSSKLVKITTEELTEIKPRKTRNWKGRRSRQSKHSECLKNTVQREQDFNRTTWGIFDQNDGSMDTASAFGLSHLNNYTENDFRDLFNFISNEDDFIRCMCPETLTDPQKLNLRGCTEYCNNSFDLPTDGLFPSYGGDEGIQQSFAECKYLLGKGTVSNLSRDIELQNSYHSCSYFYRVFQDRLRAYSLKRKQEKLLQSTHDASGRELLHAVENSANLPLKKRLKLRPSRFFNDFETNKQGPPKNEKSKA